MATRALTILFGLVSACGGAQTPTTNVPGTALTGPAAAPSTAPAPPEVAPVPPAPPVARPETFLIGARNVSIALVSAGAKRGRRAYSIRPTGREVASATIRISVAFAGAPPTDVTLHAQVGLEAGAANDDGNTTLTGEVFEVRLDVGATVLPPDVTARLQALVGARLLGAIHADGQWDALSVQVADAHPEHAELMRMLSLGLTPRLILPSQPIGVGATWTVSAPVPLVQEGLDATEVVTYKLAKVTDNVLTIEGQSQVLGADQMIRNEQMTLDARRLGGQGTVSYQVRLDDAVPQGRYRHALTFALVDAEGDLPVAVGVDVEHRVTAAP